MPDGSILVLQLPRPGEPESAMLPGMAVAAPREAVQAVQLPAPLGMPDTSIGPVAVQEPARWAYDFNTAGVSRATYAGFVTDLGTGVLMANVQDFGAVGNNIADDTAAFQAAIATGHVVYVPRGTYRLQALTLGQAMQGDGIDVTILSFIGPQNTGFITWTDTGPSSIRDLTVDGNNLASFGISTPLTAQSGLRINTVEVRNCGWNGTTTVQYGILINWDQVSVKQGCSVVNCYVHDIVGMGIGAGGTGHVIANNSVVNCGHSGIGCYGALIEGIIANNTVYNTGWNLAASSDGITGYDQSNLRTLVIGNTVTQSTNHGIHLGGANMQIVGNKVYQVTNGHGIFLQSAPNASPTRRANGMIVGNEVDTVSVGVGIRVGYTDKVLVNGNTVYNTGNNAFYFLLSSDCVCSDNTIFNATGDGIAADTGVNLIVTANRIATVTGRGINDLGASAGMIAYGNIATGEGTATAAAFNGTVAVRAALAIGGNVGFFNTLPIGKMTVSGAKGGNVALGSLLAALSAYGLVTDTTTA